MYIYNKQKNRSGRAGGSGQHPEDFMGEGFPSRAGLSPRRGVFPWSNTILVKFRVTALPTRYSHDEPQN